jgi:hypothetical protein
MWPYFTVSLKGHIRQVWLYSKIIIIFIHCLLIKYQCHCSSILCVDSDDWQECFSIKCDTLIFVESAILCYLKSAFLFSAFKNTFVMNGFICVTDIFIYKQFSCPDPFKLNVILNREDKISDVSCCILF